MRLYEKKLARKDIYDGAIINVHVDDVLLENGKAAKREVVDHNGGVCVAVLTDSDELILVRQFRYPYGKVLLELPAGKLEIGEDPFEAAVREQLEETGTTGTGYIYLGELYPSPGYCGEVIHIWACRASSSGAQRLDADEFLETELIHISKAVEMVINGDIPDAKTQLGILKTARLLQSGGFEMR